MTRIMLLRPNQRKHSLYSAVSRQINESQGGQGFKRWSAPLAHPDAAASHAGRNDMIGAARSKSELGKPAEVRLERA